MSDPKKEVHRLMPCPAYDVEEMESWLTGLAREEGLLLAQDGIFAGIATFEKGAPQQVKYRLEAAPRGASFWADNGGDPDPEAVELCRAYNWEYVAKRGNFYVYRTEDPTARELNTDPEVQALAISAVKKRQAGSLYLPLFWMIVYPLCYLNHASGLLRSAVELGSWFCLWGLALALWCTADGVIELVHLRRLIKKLRTDGVLAREKRWKGRTAPYQAKRLVQFVMVAAWVIVAFNKWAASVEYRPRQPDYQGTLPFATIADFGASGYRGTLAEFDDVQEWSDWLAPRNVKWWEHAGVVLADGVTRIEGGLEVEYHQMAAPFLARWMASELTPRRSTGPYYAELELPPLDVDYAAAFVDVFPTVVLQKGDRVLLASFYQTSEHRLELAQWAAILADSLGA